MWLCFVSPLVAKFSFRDKSIYWSHGKCDALTNSEGKKAFKAGKFKVTVAKKQNVFDEQTRAEAVALQESGVSWAEFERRTGISRSTCAKWIREKAAEADAS